MPLVCTVQFNVGLPVLLIVRLLLTVVSELPAIAGGLTAMIGPAGLSAIGRCRFGSSPAAGVRVISPRFHCDDVNKAP